ncbi:hypothetical protein Tco_1228358 [Tanacetum coccineum]
MSLKPYRAIMKTGAKMQEMRRDNQMPVNATGPVQKFKIICLITSLAMLTEENTRSSVPLQYGDRTLKRAITYLEREPYRGQRGRTYLADASFLL